MQRRPRAPLRDSCLLTGAGFLAFAALALPYVWGLGLVQVDPMPAGLPLTALVVLIKPCLMEEVLFRAPLLFVGARWVGPVAGASLLLFVAAHPLNAWLVSPGLARWFLDPLFLPPVALLGAVTTWLTLRSGRLWPAVLVHWAVVMVWLHLLDGPLPGR